MSWRGCPTFGVQFSFQTTFCVAKFKARLNLIRVRSVIDGNAFAFLLFLFVQFLLQRVARGVAVADFFHAQRGDAAAAAQGLDWFAEHVADAHAHPGKQPNIDLLLQVKNGNCSLVLKPVEA